MISIKKILLLFSINLMLGFSAIAQTENIFQRKDIGNIISSEVRNSLAAVPSGQLLVLDESKGEQLFNAAGGFTLQIPLKSGFVEVELEVATIFSPNFKVMTPNGEVAVELPHYYHGKIKGDQKSFVALTITKDAIEGLITNEKLNLTIGRLVNTDEKLHVVYNTNEIPNDTPICSEPVEVPFDGDLPELQSNATNAAGCKAVEVYLEADNQMYLDWGGSVQTVVNTMTGIFNNVSLLYHNEGINLVISTLFVWTTPDPYRTATDAGQSLDLLDAYWDGRGNDFDGDIAQLVTTKRLGGGVAYMGSGNSVFNGMTDRAVFASCSKSIAFGMSSSIVNSVVNVPTYSWNVMIIAHEIGHNFGLPHTHSCTWSNGTTTGAIDNCFATEGGCAGGPAPTNGGTIMSYCNLSSVGVNFANGFGLLPRQKMNAEVAAATCLSGSKVPRPIVANQSVCSGQSVTLTASGCTGTYQWFSAAVGGTSLSTTSTYITPVLTTSISYYVSCTVGGCVSRRRKVDVNVLNATVATTACGSNASAILVTNCNGATINWYTALTGGSLIGTGNNFVLNNINASTTVYAGCSQTGCGASPRTALQITYAALCPYCEPTGLYCSEDDVITQVKIDQGVANLYSSAVTTCSASGYSLTTPATEVVLESGQTYQLTTTTNPGVYEDGLSIWIDYNQNNIFEASEKVETFYTGAVWEQRTSSITIPANSTLGLTRIRFKLSFGSSSNDPCSATDGEGFGEIEDYVIRISGGTPCPPTLTHTTGVLPAGNYNAEQTIISQANVSTPTYYQAGNSITLNQGFEATNGSTFSAQIGGCQNPITGLVAYYPFNGNANDETGNGNNGSIIGNPLLINDRRGNSNSAFQFNGAVFNYISIPDNAMLCSNTLTLNAWVNYQSGQGGYLINKGQDISNGSFQLTTSGVVGFVDYFGINGAYYRDVPTNKWVMVTGIIAGNQVKYYVDGQVVSQATISANFNCSSAGQPLTIGNHYYNGVPDFFAYPYNGKVDDIRIYNRALTDAEVQVIYNAEKL